MGFDALSNSLNKHKNGLKQCNFNHLTFEMYLTNNCDSKNNMSNFYFNLKIATQKWCNNFMYLFYKGE